MPVAKTDKSKKREPTKAVDKARLKVGEKIVEDKTFGLKNKNKSKKVQQYVNQVKKAYTGKDEQAELLRRREMKRDKEEQSKQQKALEDLYAEAIVQPKVQFGEDPKSILCAFFKVGKCKKGDKCKFSHDLNVANKASKKSLYTDTRDSSQAEDSMANWDQAKLEMVVEENNKRFNKSISRSKTICKYFLDALENETYGWFWKCPGGGSDCLYRHALPEGFMFKTKKEREAEKILRQGDQIDKDLLQLERIEELRALLPTDKLTPVTPETFMKWKEEQMKKKGRDDERQSAIDQSKRVNKNAKESYGMTGRDLFTFNPELFVDDDEADAEHYVLEEEDNLPEAPEVNDELFGDDELPSDDDSEEEDGGEKADEDSEAEEDGGEAGERAEEEKAEENGEQAEEPVSASS